MKIIRIYTERHKSLRNHTQRFAYFTLCRSFIINDAKGEYAIYYDAVYSFSSPPIGVP